MGVLRKLVRGALSRVAARVGQDGLFEKAGERPPTQPFPTSDAPSATKGSTAASPAASERSSPSERAAARPAPSAPSAVAPARPTEGCVPVDEAGLRAAIRPGARPLVINHWATWCEPCADELPRLVRSAAGLGDVAEMIGVSWDLFDHPEDPRRAADKVARVADAAGVGFPSVLFTGEPEALYRIAGLDWHFIPQTLVVAPDGRVVWHKRGDIADDDVFALIRAAKEAAS